MCYYVQVKGWLVSLDKLLLPLHISRTSHWVIPHTTYPSQLRVDSEHHTEGTPWLYGEFSVAVPHHLNLKLRLHNQAGIPIITGETLLEAGTQAFIFQALSPLGMEAYIHKPAAERIQVAQRIWSRAAYGTLIF